MAIQMQGQQSNEPLEKQEHHKRPRRFLPIITVVLLALLVGTVWILGILDIISNFWATISSVVVTILGAVFTAFQLLSPFEKQAISVATPPLAPIPPITIHLASAPLTSSLPSNAEQVSMPPLSSSSFVNKTSYRGIVGFPPPTDPKTIQQREKAVKEIYAMLTQPGTTAIVLTGIGGVGKSTLAALVYHYIEELRRAGNETNKTFHDEPIWLTINDSVTMADLMGTLFESIGKPLLDLGSLTPQNQAVALFNALNTLDRSRLVILDQFENLLNWQTGQALADRLGVGEWIDIINSQRCRCRILLTSRLWPQGTREYPPTYMQEYRVKGLEVVEGIELLRKRDVHATEEVLQTAVERCEGHAFALTLLASLLHNRSLSLTTFFKDPVYAQLWTGNIARKLLDYIYMQQLTNVERELLLAFSIYREPVPLKAARAAIDSTTDMSNDQVQLALDALLAQHLLQASGEGRYLLHTVVAGYARNHFVESNEQLNQQFQQATHARAAQYYLQQAAISCPPREKRRRIQDVHDLIEASWQYCQAGLRQEAYTLMEQEGIFSDLNRWGGNAILFELYQLLWPLDKWHPSPLQAASISNALGWVYNVFGKKNDAQQCFDQALSLYKEIGDRRGEGTTLDHLGWVYNALGKKEQALDYCEQALSIYKEIGDRRGEANILTNLGRIYNRLGKKDEALKYYKQALSIYEEIGDRGGEGTVLDHLGWLYNALGKKEQALIYCGQALNICQEIGDRRGEGRVFNVLGRIYATLENKKEALKYYEEALNILREVGDRGGEGRVIDNLGRVYAMLGEKEKALKCYQEALEISIEVADRGGEGTTRNNLGKVYADQGQQEQAWQYYKDALSIAREVEDRRGEGATLHNIGTLCFEQCHYDVALASFLLASDILEEVQSPDHEKTQKAIDDLQKAVGEEKFAGLLAQVEPQASQIIDNALHERLP